MGIVRANLLKRIPFLMMKTLGERSSLALPKKLAVVAADGAVRAGARAAELVSQVLIDDCEIVTKNERVPVQYSSYFFWRAEQGWPSRTHFGHMPQKKKQRSEM
jgi:hypothetical protein